jgi:beta-mannosidase
MTGEMPVVRGWRCVATPPGHFTDPAELLAAADLRWLPAQVPGTAAGAVRAAAGVAAMRGRRYDDEDWWFVGTVDQAVPGPALLRLDGLATRATVWLDDDLIAESESMFMPTRCELKTVCAGARLAIRFHSLSAQLGQRRPRARWRTALADPPGLRWVRTTMLGRAPIFGSVPAPVGPWQPVDIVSAGPADNGHNLTTRVEGTRGIVRLRGRWPVGEHTTATIRVGEHVREVALATRAGMHELDSTIVIENVALWWPHTQGTPTRYPVTLDLGDDRYDWGHVGFRTVAVDESDGGFTLSINGVSTFCRGACWVPLDPATLAAGPAELRAVLEQVREAGLNMLRLTGTMVYESPEFWDLCAELGILIWQDVMLATFDPPVDDDFERALRAEVGALLSGLAGNPALAVFSGGSETRQQPTMLGMPAVAIDAIDRVLPALVAEFAPGIPYVASSPAAPPGSSAPVVHVGSGVAHYFGVGGYLLPPSDVRSARVRFAAECLAFANPPEPAAVDEWFGSAAVAGHHPDWKSGVPRDRGASWDFDDVRDHYVRELFEVEPFAVRREDPQRYLDLGRAVVCELVRSCFDYWRRPESGCGGALVLALRDLEPGAGWGLTDSAGRPKAPWYALRRASLAIAVIIADEALDGLWIRLHNDRAEPLRATLLVRVCTTDAVALDVSVAVEVDQFATGRWSLDELLDGFFDVNYAYRFGTRIYDAVAVTVVDSVGIELAQDVLLLGAIARPRQHDVGLSANAVSDATGQWWLEVGTTVAAHYVAIDIAGYLPRDSWFHLPPGGSRRIAIDPLPATRSPSRPLGRVRALNAVKTASVRIAESM